MRTLQRYAPPHFLNPKRGFRRSCQRENQPVLAMKPADAKTHGRIPFSMTRQ